MTTLFKYPRTQHIEGSRLGPGDEDLTQVPFAALAGAHLVVEEKMDGANAGLSFDEDGRLLLQSRGHFLTGGDRERHFDLFKQQAHALAPVLRERLGSRRVLYGEWLYAKHTIFYDALPGYFLEFDVLDLDEGAFLSTERRHALLEGTGLPSVPVLHRGPVRSLDRLVEMVARSTCKSVRWRLTLEQVIQGRHLTLDSIQNETDPTDLMEGLYLKHEENGRVVGRYKWVRPSFLTQVVDSGSHWLARPILPNQVTSRP